MSCNVGKAEIKELISAIYQVEGCGICGKPGGEIFWFSPTSRGAHTVCYEKIRPAEENLRNKISELFANKPEKANDAHINAIKHVRLAMKEDSMLEYIEKNGIEKLKEIMDTVGVKFVEFYKRRVDLGRVERTYL